MTDSIDRNILLDLLGKWESRLLDESKVHNEAESLWDAGEQWSSKPNEDPRSIATEVLSTLDTLNVGFIGREDIAAIRAFLETPSGEELNGWKAWESYWAAIDVAERENSIGADGYYRRSSSDKP